MRIALASYRCENRDIAFNIRQIEKGMKDAKEKADLILFSEAYLQGFDSLDWDHESDLRMAIARDSVVISRLIHKSEEYGIAVGFGYIEKEGEDIYSSYIILSEGEIVYNYRRISKGWKEYTRTDDHYREGEGSQEFTLFGHQMKIALCGDLWDHPEQFRTQGILLWPVYVCFQIGDYEEEVPEYAGQAALVSDLSVMVNCIDPDSHGGAFVFEKGEVKSRIPYDEETILYYEV